ncbi:homeodomain-containing protein [Ordospora colligata]|uniref:Homeodomain-containing protein n=1 Tax=Ordospora colligata OC4 TaxID=1354746 RepID=A0A0B2ULM9_9MICR|nr:homeodomain-containing protein [Ordospora colligata OC4]KHN69952.1 homeodomain-containing protein [Ordospora colligata OC4]TBU16122.1 homeodomain-containing protein [Ordospora colligata]TBU16335.1 homeodomain-containing protein [Ordospora colligata]TBU19039.1 homeodomain-containing protein [Ordospora colligata]
MRLKAGKKEKKVKFIDSTNEIIKHMNTSENGKRSRLRLNAQQASILEQSFKNGSHPSNKVKAELAMVLCIPLKNVQIWFQNRRAKEKIGVGAMKVVDGEETEMMRFDERAEYQTTCSIDFPVDEKYFSEYY